jgi:rRNA small subunit pseudouridine methyltransferase Nep1
MRTEEDRSSGCEDFPLGKVGVVASMLTFVLAESAIELVPKELLRHPSVIAHARRKGKRPDEIILDRAYHHSAMKAMLGKDSALKRGRPDIAHLTLLNLLETPLSLEGRLKTYIHTLEDRVIEVDPQTRLPRNYDRFIGLLEQLYALGRVPPTGKALITLSKKSLHELVNELKSPKVIALTTLGEPESLKTLCSELATSSNPIILVGGFPHSHFSEKTLSVADRCVSIYRETLNAWVVAARLVYEYECQIGIYL